MNRLVTGLGGTGKTYMVVHDIFWDYLKNSNRPISTNLPINLTELFRYHNVKPGAEDKYRKRIRFLKNKFSPAYGYREYTILENGEKLEREEEHEELYPNAKIEREKYLIERPEIKDRMGNVLVPENMFHEIREFWRFVEEGSVNLIDEIGRYASAINRELRSFELGNYMSQWRHFKHDNWFIAQKPDQVDKQIRDQIDRRYICERSDRMSMFKNKFLGEYKWPWPLFFFKMREILNNPLATGGWKNGEEGRKWTRWWPSKRSYKVYRSYSKSDALSGSKSDDDEEIKGDDQTQAKKNLVNVWADNSGRLLTLLVVFGTIFWIGYTYFANALGWNEKDNDKSAPAEAHAHGEKPKEDPQQLLASSVATPVPVEKEPNYFSIQNPGLTRDEIEEVFEGSGFLVGEKIIVEKSFKDLADIVTANGRAGRPHYARFVVVRFRDWEGIDLQAIQQISLAATQDGTKLNFGFEYKAKNTPSDYEILTLLDAVLIAGRPLIVNNGKILREDQSSSAENGRVFTSGKFEEEIGLKFEFTPYQYPSKRVIRGEMLLDDTTGDTLDETAKSSMQSWVELTPSLRLVGSVTREYVRTDSDTIIPFTGWIPLVRSMRWENEVHVKELLAVYGQHFPDEPAESSLGESGATQIPRFAAGAIIEERYKLPIDYAIRGEQIPEEAKQNLKDEPMSFDLSPAGDTEN